MWETPSIWVTAMQKKMFNGDKSKRKESDDNSSSTTIIFMPWQEKWMDGREFSLLVAGLSPWLRYVQMMMIIMRGNCFWPQLNRIPMQRLEVVPSIHVHWIWWSYYLALFATVLIYCHFEKEGQALVACRGQDCTCGCQDHDAWPMISSSRPWQVPIIAVGGINSH